MRREPEKLSQCLAKSSPGSQTALRKTLRAPYPTKANKASLGSPEKTEKLRAFAWMITEIYSQFMSEVRQYA